MWLISFINNSHFFVLYVAKPWLCVRDTETKHKTSNFGSITNKDVLKHDVLMMVANSYS